MRISHLPEAYFKVCFLANALVHSLAAAYYESYFGHGKIRLVHDGRQLRAGKLLSSDIGKHAKAVHFL